MFNYILLKQLRKNLELSQQEMARRLDMEQSTYNRYKQIKHNLGFMYLKR